MTIKNISEVKSQLSALIEQVRKGKEFVIGKAGKPVAKLVPYSGLAAPRTPGALKGEIFMAPDFDDCQSEIAELFGLDREKSS